MHMAQHVLLLTVAPPLLVLGRPWPRMWMPFPPARAARRRPRARARPWSAPLRLAARTLTRPPVALAVLRGDARRLARAARSTAPPSTTSAVHVLEHACFLVPRARSSGGRCSRRRRSGRASTICAAHVWFGRGDAPGWILAIVLAYASQPLYDVYASLPHRAFGLSALGDQQIAAGVMWVPGSLAYLVAFVVFVYRWLEPGVETPRREPRPEELSWT